MQIIFDEEDMKLKELKIEILEWAKSRSEPFTSGMAFESIKDVDDVKAVSDAVRILYTEGKLVRKKIDGVRFSYALTEYAPDDYEFVPKKSDQTVEISADAEKPIEKPAPESQPAPVIKAESSKSSEKPAEKSVPPRKTAIPDLIITAAEPEKAAETKPLQLPDTFTLTLQTASGLTITIQTGATCS